MVNEVGTEHVQRACVRRLRGPSSAYRRESLVSPNSHSDERAPPEGFVFVATARLGRERPGDVALENPVAAISAFCAVQTGIRAETAGRPPGYEDAATAQTCLDEAVGRPDVSILETSDPVVTEAASVFATCLISLHRSSSFGPDIARAVTAGRSGDRTAYGGPMDYLKSGTGLSSSPMPSRAKRHRLPSLRAGVTWAEPDQTRRCEVCERSIPTTRRHTAGPNPGHSPP